MDDLSLLRLLDSCHKDEVEEVHGIVSAGLEARRSPWVVNTLVDYYFRYGSFEALSLLKTLPEVQAQCLFDKLIDSLQKRETRIPSLELLLQLCTAQEDHPSFGLPVLTVAMFCVTMVTLANISITAELFYVVAVLVITVVCPAWFIRLQALKNNIHGPWDEAAPTM